MKTISRNFVVEYKTNRRRKLMSSNSIWGDTDLKAVAAAIDSESTTGSDLASKRAASIGSEFDVSAPKADPIEQRFTPELVSPISSLESVSQVAEPESFSQTHQEGGIKVGRRGVQGRSKTPSSSAGRSRQMMSSEAVATRNIDELEALAHENVRLKALMCAKLHHENSVLRKMLERFLQPR